MISKAKRPQWCFDVFGEQGHPVRATVSEMGPLLLARLLELNDTQEGILKNRPSVLSEALGTVTAAFQPTIGPRGGVRDSVATSMAKSAMRAASSQIGRQLVRGVLGGILGGSGRRR
jgi:DNA helicase HerA-like ATPase